MEGIALTSQSHHAIFFYLFSNVCSSYTSVQLSLQLQLVDKRQNDNLIGWPSRQSRSHSPADRPMRQPLREILSAVDVDI